MKAQKVKIVLNVFYLSLLNQSIAFVVALLLLSIQSSFGYGDIYSFLYLSIAHSISIGLIGVYQSRFLYFHRFWVRAVVSVFTGILFALTWTYTVAFLMLGPWIMAFSFSVFLAWITSGTFTLLINTLRKIDRDTDELSNKPTIEQKRSKSYLRLAGLMLILPVGFAVVFWIITFISIFASVLFSWEFKEGAISTSGNTSCRLINKGAGIVSITGHRRISASYLKEISICHALILKSDVKGKFLSSSIGYETDGPVAREVYKYLVELESGVEQSYSWSIELHMIDSTLKVGNSVFNLIDGNFVLIIVDSMFNTKTTQFPITNNEIPDCSKIVEQFNKVIKGHIVDYPLVLHSTEKR